MNPVMSMMSIPDCSHALCHRSFYQKVLGINNPVKHTESYICDACECHFSESKDYISHMRTHLNLVTCDKCHVTCYSQNSLKKHKCRQPHSHEMSSQSEKHLKKAGEIVNKKNTNYNKGAAKKWGKLKIRTMHTLKKNSSTDPSDFQDEQSSTVICNVEQEIKGPENITNSNRDRILLGELEIDNKCKSGRDSVKSENNEDLKDEISKGKKAGDMISKELDHLSSPLEEKQIKNFMTTTDSVQTSVKSEEDECDVKPSCDDLLARVDVKSRHDLGLQKNKFLNG